MRRLELTAGAARWQGGREIWWTNEAMRHAERELALQAQRAYERTIKDWQPTKGRERDTGARIKGPSKGHSRAADPKPQTICALLVSRSRPPTLSHTEAVADPADLTFIRRPKRQR